MTITERMIVKAVCIYAVERDIDIPSVETTIAGQLVWFSLN